MIQHELETKGYSLVRRLLNPEKDILPLIKAYSDLFDSMAELLLLKEQSEHMDLYRQGSFPERFARLLALSSGTLFHHLAPAIPVLYDDYQWQPNLPSAQFRELFQLMRHDLILDVLDGILGHEISASSLYHLNFKLPTTLQKLIIDVTQKSGKEISHHWLYELDVGETPWHMDAYAGFRNTYASKSIIVWIPLNEVTLQNGCLQVIPKPPDQKVASGDISDDLKAKAVPIIAQVGDVLFMDHKTYHNSLPNISKENYRWALSFRYFINDQLPARPFLPSVVLRSRNQPTTELHHAEIWSQMWRHALAYRDKTGSPLKGMRLIDYSFEEAQVLTQYWRALTPDHDSWLRL